jgi:glycerophosphoryl diester phosphodiesterase
LSASSKSPLIIGHRGASAVAPENTLAAFNRAFADGVEGIEFDVQLSRDGVPVVIHDATLKRTGGRVRSVADMTAAELARCDVGSWFNRAHPALARAEYTEQVVPTLEQLWARLRALDRNDWTAYLELKIDRGQEYRDLVKAVANLIANYEFEKQIVVISFKLAAVSLIKELNSAIRTGALFEPRRSAHRVVRKHSMISEARDCGASEILFHRLLATQRIIDVAREADLVPVVWTVDDVRWIERAQARGIHALMTNSPAKLIAQRQRMI